MKMVKSYLLMMSKNKFLQSLKCSFFILLSLQTSFAQVSQRDTSHVTLRQVVISATKNPENIEDVSQKIEVLDKQNILTAQSQTAADLVQNINGVTVQKSQQGGGSPVIRGFEANHIVLLLDGIRLNNLIFRAGHLQNILLLSTEQLDRVEVEMGSASTIYGSDALGGAICAYTPTPYFQNDSLNPWKIGAHMRLASVNYEKNAALKIQYSNEKLYSLSSFHFVKYNDLKMGKNKNPFADGYFGLRNYYIDQVNNQDTLIKNIDPFLQVKSAYSQYNFLQKIGFKSNENTIHELTFLYTNSSDIPRYDRLTDMRTDSTLKYAEWYYGPQKFNLLGYHLKHKNENQYFQNIDLNLYQQKYQESRHQRQWLSNNLDNRFEKVRVYGGMFDATHKGNRSELQIGLDLIRNTLQSSAYRENIVTEQTTTLDTRYPDGDNRYTEISGHIFHIYHYNEYLTFNEGARLGYADLYSTLSDTSFFQFPFKKIHQKNVLYSGTVGAIVKLDKHTNLRGNISSGYRVPNVDDLSKIFESSPGNLIVPNPNLKPESTINYEIGIAQHLMHQSWNLQLFYTDYRNKIALADYSYNDLDSILYQGSWSHILANRNVEKAFIYGFQLDYSKYLSKHLEFFAQGTYTYGRVQNDSIDTPLDHIAPFTSKLGLNVKFQKTHTQIYTQYQAAKKLQDYSTSGEDNLVYTEPNGSPAWFTVNLKTSYSPTNMVSIQAGIENILDTQYRTFSSGINAPGRNFYIGISLNP